MEQMGKWNFDQEIERRGFGKKWDELPYGAKQGESTPMWIADMDFAAPACVIEAMSRRLQHPTFGYFTLDHRFYDAIIKWQRRWGVADLRPEMICYQNSTVGGIAAALSMLTQPGDPILVHLPNYTGFTHAIADTGRRLVSSPLVKDAQGVYRMDFADMQKRVEQEKIQCVILCSPHNPTGRVWQQDELDAFSAFCEAHGLTVIADEIWADFVFAPNRHLPAQQQAGYLRDHTISFYAPTKSFNLAGLRVAYSVVYGEALRRQFHSFCLKSHYNVPNPLSAEALIGAYEQGADYVEQLVAYIRGNMEYAKGWMDAKIPEVEAYLPEGTYTLWVNLKKTGRTDDENLKRMIAAGVVPNMAQEYNDTGHIRLNLACPRAQLERALCQLEQALCAH